MARRYCEHCSAMDTEPMHITHAPLGTYPADPAAVAAVLGSAADDAEKADAIAALSDTTDNRHHVSHCAEIGCDIPQEG